MSLEKHNLSFEDGDASMMYVGKAPWHGFGTKLEKPATAAEAIKSAKLDWRVVKEPLFVRKARRYLPLEGQYAIYREGRPKNVFGVVSESYTPLQNGEAFEFFDFIVGADAAIYHTAGALGKGERVWLLAQLPGHIRVVGDDITEKFLLLTNSHDGTRGVQIKFTPVRVVCQNTLTMALRDGDSISIFHTPRIWRDLSLARRQLDLIDTRYQDIEDEFRKLAAVILDSDRAAEFVAGVFPEPERGDDEREFERERERAKKLRQKSIELFEAGKGSELPGVRGTLWGAYNAITELIDHHQRYRSQESRMATIVFGDGAAIKKRAFRVAKEKSRQWKD